MDTKFARWLSVILITIITSCTAKNKERFLPGKIAVESYDHVCKVYDHSDSPYLKFSFKNDEKVQYSGFAWLNKTDAFIGSEYISSASHNDYKGNIAVFDSTGKIVERIYASQNGEVAGLPFPSRNDKHLLFIEQKIDSLETNPFEGLMPMYSIVLMDLKKKQVIKVLKNVGRSPIINIDESPWVFDEVHFIYSYDISNGIANNVNQPNNDSAGIYMYDLNTDQTKLLVPSGRYGICSPVEMQIAYIKNQSVWTMDLTTNSTKILYKASSNEKVSNIHWTPDGKYVYLTCFKDYILDFFTSDEKLIEIATGNPVPFKKIEHGFGMYTWK